MGLYGEGPGGFPKTRFDLEPSPAGRRLKNFRRLNTMSQQQLADKAGCSRSAVAMLENGHMQSMSVSLAKRFGRALKVDWTAFYKEVPDR